MSTTKVGQVALEWAKDTAGGDYSVIADVDAVRDLKALIAERDRYKAALEQAHDIARRAGWSGVCEVTGPALNPPVDAPEQTR